MATSRQPMNVPGRALLPGAASRVPEPGPSGGRGAGQGG